MRPTSRAPTSTAPTCTGPSSTAPSSPTRNFVGADFGSTSFLGAHITGTRVTPSNIGADRFARHFFFQRVYIHVNAYGSSGSCSGSGSGDVSDWGCNGTNDDSSASPGLEGDVYFGWGKVTQGRRTFVVDATHVRLTGYADPGLAAFHVQEASRSLMDDTWRTFEDAPRGHPGGPLALHIGYHHGLLSGYHMNLSGWVQRRNYAPSSGPR